MARRPSRHPDCSRGCRRRSERAAERRIAADAMGEKWSGDESMEGRRRR
jgi:hypothetical protein